MPELVGIIEEKNSKNGIKSDGKTPYTRTTYKINGMILSTFFNFPFNIGENVKVIYEINGQYNNISSMIKEEQTPQTQTSPIQNQVPTQNKVPTPIVNDYQKNTEASKVAGMLISYCKDLVIADKINIGKLKENVSVLIDIYKTTKQKLL